MRSLPSPFFTWPIQSRRFWAHNLNSQGGCRVWYPCGWFWPSAGTWHPGEFDTKRPWCDPETSAEEKRWSCADRTAWALWSCISLERSQCEEAEILKRIYDLHLIELGKWISWIKNFTCRISRQERTLSCLKKRIILSSRKTRLELTKLWKTLGNFLRATRFPSLGSVTDQTTPNAPYPMGRSGIQSLPPPDPVMQQIIDVSYHGHKEWSLKNNELKYREYTVLCIDVIKFYFRKLCSCTCVAYSPTS